MKLNQIDNQVARQALTAIRAKLAKARGGGRAHPERWQPQAARPLPAEPAQTVTPAQSHALGQMQVLCREILKLEKQINTMDVTFGLGFGRMMMFDVGLRLVAIDERIRMAQRAARQLGVEPVVHSAKLAPMPQPQAGKEVH